MPVMIACPVCAEQVRLLKGGLVAVHGADPCPFTRTARSSGMTAIRPGQERPKGPAEPPEVKLTHAQLAKVTEAAEKVSRKARAAAAKITCPTCQQRVAPNGKTATGLAAHVKPSSGRWCSGGAEPTDAQRNKVRAKRSVWASSGGLPTLGRR